MINNIWTSTIRFFLLRILGKERVKKHILNDEEKKALSFVKNGYLYEKGWFQSYKRQKPVDGNDQPIPWVTYTFLDFINERIRDSFNIFEYGGGSSTLFFSQKVNNLVTVEHDEEWYRQLEKIAPKNVTLIYESLEYGGRYAETPSRTGQKFHIIIVDGRDRVNCCSKSLNALHENGVIVLDDSERKQYRKASQFLKNHNFKKVDFWGIAPGVSFNKCTSIFYRERNCLEI